MAAITTVGLDIAKSVFQVHGVDAQGSVVVRRQLKRRYVLAYFKKLPPCLVGVEACATSHHWSRELQALGHTVRLIPPAYVKPYVKRQKNDAADAEAICEAVQRPSMRFVPTKTPEQQSCLMLHLVRGISSSGSKPRSSTPSARIWPSSALSLRSAATASRNCSTPLPMRGTNAFPKWREDVLKPWARCSAGSRPADPGVRPTDQRLAPLERDVPAARRAARRRPCTRNRAGGQRCRSEGVPIGPRLLGLDRSGSEAELERGSREARQVDSPQQGDRYLRSLFTAGALAVIRYAKIHGSTHRPWLTKLLQRRPTKVAAIALANKIARMAWAMMTTGERYREPLALAR